MAKPLLLRHFAGQHSGCLGVRDSGIALSNARAAAYMPVSGITACNLIIHWCLMGRSELSLHLPFGYTALYYTLVL